MLLNDRDQIIAMTAEWTGERYPNGRPRVSDEKIKILKIWCATMPNVV